MTDLEPLWSLFWITHVEAAEPKVAYPDTFSAEVALVHLQAEDEAEE